MSRMLVFEIGAEEIPAAPLDEAVAQLEKRVPEALAEARLRHGEVTVDATPRRLTIVVRDLVERQEDQHLTVKGPAVKNAFDAEGRPTVAATGFARSKGVAVEDLVCRDDESGSYLVAVLDRPGLGASEVLPGLLGDLVSSIEWPKSQRWGSGEERFVRPVRWLLALFGRDVVPAVFGGLTAGRVTYGHRFLAPGPVEVPRAEEYDLAMRRGRVMVDQRRRAEEIRAGIEAAAERMGASAVVPAKTFSEVVNLVEWPTVGVGRYDGEFLRLPREVLETAMESHQRYFPLEGPDGRLLPNFVVVHNGDPERTEAIVAGHERVIRARLADAAFFYDEDLSVPLETLARRVGTIVFQERLGTLGAKVARVEELAERLAQMTGAGEDETAWAVRGAHLAKCDLVSHVVVEFPLLQGVMGRYYALAGGEAPEVADAVFEHYMPRFSGDVLPPSSAGKLVSVADKLDTVAGIFAIGMAPTGSADPYALRRAALGILHTAIEGGLRFRLDEAVGAALDGYQPVVEGVAPEKTGSEVRGFFVTRIENLLRDRGFAHDTVAAVLAVASNDPADAVARVRALGSFRGDEDFDDLVVAFARANNLGEPELGTEVDVEMMGPEEAALHEAVERARLAVGAAIDAERYDEALERLAALRAPIDDFFEKVLVMDPDPVLRDNRLRLLNRFTALFSRFADFSRLQV